MINLLKAVRNVLLQLAAILTVCFVLFVIIWCASEYSHAFFITVAALVISGSIYDEYRKLKRRN